MVSRSSTPESALKAGGIFARLDLSSRFDVVFVPVVVIVLVIYLAATSSGFLTAQNLTSILLQGSILALVAFGMTFLILVAELDLSVGSGVALVSVVSALVMRDSGSVWLGIVAGIGTGLALGLFNSQIVTRLEVPAFVATLATLVIAHGIALALTNGAVIGPLPSGIEVIASDSFLGVRLLTWLLIITFVSLYFVQRWTSFGAKVMAVGGNKEAARLSGVNVNRVRVICFVIVGLMVGLAGVALTSRVGSGQPNAGALLALTAIAAVVIGGASISGGRGSLVGTLSGVLLLSVLDNGLDIKGVTPELKEAVIGIVFIGAASVDFVRTRARRRSAERSVAEVLARDSVAPTSSR